MCTTVADQRAICDYRDMDARGVIRSRVLRSLLRILAGLCIGLGAIGVVLPGLPTTPFLLVAAWAAGKSSPELQRRLCAHPRFGPALVAWQDERAIPRRAKWLALALMAASWMMLWFTIEHRGVISLIGAMLAAMAVFLFTRPEPVGAAHGGLDRRVVGQVGLQDVVDRVTAPSCRIESRRSGDVGKPVFVRRVTDMGHRPVRETTRAAPVECQPSRRDAGHRTGYARTSPGSQHAGLPVPERSSRR